MNSSRSNILKAIKSHNADNMFESDIKTEATNLLDDLELIQPTVSGENPIDNFLAKLDGKQIVATHEVINSNAELPAAIHRYNTQCQLSNQIIIQPIAEFTNLDWTGFDVYQHSNYNQQLAITKGLYGIAETGSIMIQSAQNHPILLNFLSDHHIIVLDAENIFNHLDDFAKQIDDGEDLARLTCLITGASGTTDIEGVLVNGAHGPKKLHVVIVRE